MTPLRNARTANLNPQDRIAYVEEAALRIRHHILDMGEVQGQGYVGQGLGFADVLAAVYVDQVETDLSDPFRDRVLLSIGHYAIALYAALAEAGILDVNELETYGSDESRLPMSGMSTYTPGMEISGGALGHGLGIAVGMALGYRYQRANSRIIALISDGELDEGSTWEAAMAAASHGLGNLLCICDVNGLQADGPTAGVLSLEPLAPKWESFGWRVQRADGNDVASVLKALDESPINSTHPAIILFDTKPGKGVPFLEIREKAHFLNIGEEEWAIAREELRQGASK